MLREPPGQQGVNALNAAALRASRTLSGLFRAAQPKKVSFEGTHRGLNRTNRNFGMGGGAFIVKS